MAVTKTQLAAVRDTANNASLVVTMSRAITANEPCLLFYFAHATAPADSSTASGGGVTWTKRATSQRGNIRITVFSADGVASPSGTSITVNNGTGAGTANDVFIYELAGTDDTPSGWLYNANNAASSTTVTMTLGSTPAAGDYGIVSAGFLATGGLSWTGSFTEDTDGTHASPSCNTGVASDDGSPPQAVTATGPSANCVGGYVGVIVATSGESHSGTVTATGGGVLTAGGSKGATVALTHVGGGVYVQVKTTNRNRAQPLVGGGVVTFVKSTNRNRAQPLTGGGVLTRAQTTARNLASLLTGGGVLIVAGSGSSSESHSGAAQLTASGMLAIMQASGRFGSITLSASGKLSLLGGQIALSDLGTIMQGIADQLVAEGVTERAYGWPVEDMTTPCVVVGFPDRIEYDATFARGADIWFIPVYFVCGKITTKAARDTMANIVTGAVSVKEKLDGNLGGLVDTLRVTDMRILNLNVAGVDYLSALFDTEIYN